MGGETSEGTLLGGKLRYRQLRSGHRTGFEPVLLAAAIAARPGETVLEFGTGAGAALLCLAHRVPGIFAVGVELLGELARLAGANFRENRFVDLAVVQADADYPLFNATFDHVFANPPWHDAAGTASPDARRALAHQASANLLERWVAAMAAAARPTGTLTLILPAAGVDRATAILAANDWRGLSLLPLAPRLGRRPKQMILRARRDPQTTEHLPALVLHDDCGISREADAILVDGAGLLPFHGETA